MKLSEIERAYDKGRPVKADILQHRRKYFIGVKSSLLKGFLTLGSNTPFLGKLAAVIKMLLIYKRYPDIRKEDRKKLKYNTVALVDIINQFTEYNRTRSGLFDPTFRVFLAQYESDQDYADRFDWIVEKLVEARLDGRWKKLEPHRPAYWWVEPSVIEAKARLMEELGRGFINRVEVQQNYDRVVEKLK